MTSRIIAERAHIDEGAAWLAKREPLFARALADIGPLPLRRRKGGFEAVLSAIVSQQLSVAAADSIWRRMKAARLTGPRKIAGASDEALRACGLSRQKIAYARSLATSGINYVALENQPDHEVVRILTEVNGIGVWTGEIYAMFSLGRADVFAAGDLALQEAARLLFSLDKRPNERALRNMARDWSPWRAVAARILWAYYRIEKSREGIR